MGFLSTDEINALLESLTGKEQLAAKLCLSTGARWGEVVKLTQNDVIQQRVIFVNTKNSKNRTVPISAELFKELKAKGNGKVYPDVDYLLVRQLLKEVAPDLPKGQAIAYLCKPFYDERRQYFDAAKDTRPFQYFANHDLCAFCTGLLAGCG
ncbi:tyrosine-type recombinase/integrase [Yersinia ruckeri]|nr:tyrosine-type recombinase/integrase [Yersinia ruckeri]MCW6544379.1 tyrosine-type recombinase/integrase [Yersinia ruckeri]